MTASRSRGVIYVGMTSELAGRAWEHRERVMEGFTKRYWVDRLVYFEPHADADVAANRERLLKRWHRSARSGKAGSGGGCVIPALFSLPH
jgi:putative endonuclease